jgi:ferric-dicitrate binding protein FerR (iron transport regulator)
MLTRRSLLIATSLLGISPGVAAAAIDPVEAGNVVTARGSATGRINNIERPLASGNPVFLGDRLATGAEARLSVLLAAKTRLSLGENTRVHIDKMLADHGGELTLGSGALLFSRPEDPPSGPLELHTPYALIVARGTEFFAGPSQGAFGVYVEHGVVTVRTKAGAVTLGPGLGTNIKGLSEPPSEPKVWAPARVYDAKSSVG